MNILLICLLVGLRLGLMFWFVLAFLFWLVCLLIVPLIIYVILHAETTSGLYLAIFLLISVFMVVFLKEYWNNRKGLRLNKYYTYSKKTEGLYLHHTPRYIFYWIKNGEILEKYRKQAIEKLVDIYPNENLYTITMTLQTYYEKTGLIGERLPKKHFIKKAYIRFSTYALILFNLRRPHKWLQSCWSVSQTIPIKYKIH